MKKLEKMSLANIRNKLTRKEMSNIMAGSGSSQSFSCTSDADCAKVCDRREAYCANYASLPRTCLMCCY